MPNYTLIDKNLKEYYIPDSVTDRWTLKPACIVFGNTVFVWVKDSFYREVVHSESVNAIWDLYPT
jgi:hypothetical protein